MLALATCVVACSLTYAAICLNLFNAMVERGYHIYQDSMKSKYSR